MTPILTQPHTSNPETWQSRWEAYCHYIEAIRPQLPSALAESASALWRYNALDHRSFHDAIVESIVFLVVYDPEGNAHTHLELTLLGAYNDVQTRISYKDVKGWNMPFLPASQLDWNLDEFALDQECLIHRIRWVSGTIWEIAFRDIEIHQKSIPGNESIIDSIFTLPPESPAPLREPSKMEVAMTKALARLGEYKIFKTPDRDFEVSSLIPARSWRPLNVSWWKEKSASVIGEDPQGNLYIVKSDGSVVFWDFGTSSYQILSPGVRAFVSSLVKP
jgi:hypothetical protein